MGTLPLFESEDIAATEARDAEYHPTPGDVVRALLDGMAAAGHEPLPDGLCIEPAVGERGAIIRAVDALRPSTSRIWHACDIRYSAAWSLGGARVEFADRLDFIAAPMRPTVADDGFDRYVLAITNPPWSLALDFAAGCLKVADHVALHVPLATVETPGRAAWLREHKPDLYPLEWRPNYDGRGTVGRPVCWLVWGPGRGGRWHPLRRPGGG